jgi:uncharacterized protein (UPF0264 family)
VRAEAAQAGKDLVLVVYADDCRAHAPPAREVFALAESVDCRWVLVDTFDKGGSALTELVERAELRRLFSAAAATSRRIMAAGKLRRKHFSELPLELIDLIGVRGAACRGDRSSTVCRRRVRRLREALDVPRVGAQFYGA